MKKANKNRDIGADRLRELLDYDYESGQFTWRVDRRGRFARAGVVAGTLTKKDGRNQICVDGRIYLASRLAVLWMTGRWPARLVDHRNLTPADDSWKNLRDADHSQNGANSRGRSGVKGVVFTKGAYQANIRVKYKNIYLGRFSTSEAAHAAYVAAARQHFGDFARGA